MKRKRVVFGAIQCIVFVSLVSWIFLLSNQSTCTADSPIKRIQNDSFIPFVSDSGNKSTQSTGEVQNLTASVARWNESNPIVQITAFKFCTPLNNATFTFPIPVSELQIEQAIEAIESKAKVLVEDAKIQNQEYHQISLLRYACFTSVYRMNDINLNDMQDHPNNTTDIKRLDIRIKSLASSYFPFLSYEESNSVRSVRKHLTQNENCNYKRHYKIAYVLMGHNHGFKEIKNLYSLLYDEDVFFYYHIDAKDPWLKRRIKEWMRNDPYISSRCNAALIPNPTTVIWGHASMLFAQLELFFQLNQLIAFDYVINLSAEHYPMKSTSAIYHLLEV